jgi:hypothetical protein
MRGLSVETHTPPPPPTLMATPRLTLAPLRVPAACVAVAALVPMHAVGSFAAGVAEALKLLLIWVLVLFGGGSAAQLIAAAVRRDARRGPP